MFYSRPEAKVLGDAAIIIQARKGDQPTDGQDLNHPHIEPD
jgi:hypothetical protein